MTTEDGRRRAYRPLVRAERLSDRVAEQLQRRITSGELPPGTRLPAERDLAEAFQVSRTVIREAVRALLAKGLVEVQQGSGTLVRRPSASTVSDALAFMMHTLPGGASFRDAHEIRCVLEPAMAAAAALRRHEADVAAMRAELEQMQVGKSWQAPDVRFHTALARATHNPLYPILLSSIQDVLREMRELGARLPETRGNAIRHHTAIFEAVTDGDADRARAAMVAHLAQAERTIERAVRAAKDNDSTKGEP